MTTRLDCTLDGLCLSGINESVCVLDIRQDAPKLREAALPLPGGGRLLHQARESLSVHILFAIREPEELRRQQIFADILSWAEKGSQLAISPRPGQHLRVRCADHSAFHAEDWTETLSLTFESTLIPCWEDTAITVGPLDGTADFTAPGNADSTPVSLQLVNQGDAAVTQLTLSCGDTQMVFDGIELPAGGVFTLDDTGDVLRAAVDSQSVLLRRTADSDDHLLAPCGKTCTITVSAAQPLAGEFMVRGRYL